MMHCDTKSHSLLSVFKFLSAGCETCRMLIFIHTSEVQRKSGVEYIHEFFPHLTAQACFVLSNNLILTFSIMIIVTIIYLYSM